MTEEKGVPDNIEKQYDQIGLEYITEKEKYMTTRVSPGMEFILKHLKNPDTSSIVDVGCGGGDDILAYQLQGFRDIKGIDPSSIMVEAASKRLKDADIVSVGSWMNMPFSADSKDYLVGRSSLHYVEDLDVAYTEAARVLKPGGKLIVVSPHPDKRGVVIKKDGREYLQHPVFHGTTLITYPKHTHGELFSPRFHELFDLEERKEYKSSDSPEYIPPDRFAFVAMKL